MDIEIRVTPRRIERAVFIIIVVILVILNTSLYNKLKASEKKIDCRKCITAAGKNQSVSAAKETSKMNKSSQSTTTTTTTTSSTIAPLTNQTNTNQNGSNSSGLFAQPPPGREDCIAGWKCYTSYTRAFLTANCRWINLQNCSDGCENGNCNAE